MNLLKIEKKIAILFVKLSLIIYYVPGNLCILIQLVLSAILLLSNICINKWITETQRCSMICPRWCISVSSEPTNELEVSSLPSANRNPV